MSSHPTIAKVFSSPMEATHGSMGRHESTSASGVCNPVPCPPPGGRMLEHRACTPPHCSPRHAPAVLPPSSAAVCWSTAAPPRCPPSGRPPPQSWRPHSTASRCRCVGVFNGAAILTLHLLLASSTTPSSSQGAGLGNVDPVCPGPRSACPIQEPLFQLMCYPVQNTVKVRAFGNAQCGMPGCGG